MVFNRVYSKLSSLRVELLLLVGSIIICLVVLEFLFRLWSLAYVLWFFDFTNISFRGDIMESLASTLVFRTDHYNSGKPEGVFRIVVLGDSYAWGEGIRDYRMVWPYLIEDELRKNGLNVEVVNFGYRGATLSAKRSILEKNGWMHDPDMVILQFSFNDAVPSGRMPDELYVYHDLSRFGLEPFHSILLRYSYLYGWFNARMTYWELKPEYLNGEIDLYEDDSASYIEFENSLGQIIHAAEDRNIPVMIQLLDTRDDDKTQKIFQKVELRAREFGYAVCDVRSVFADSGMHEKDWWLSSDDMHPNARAQGIIGNATIDCLRANSLLPTDYPLN
ncbi:SGNH/GDSL hydrolase family protein [Candidatus Altiarchaeota archaeon]